MIFADERKPLDTIPPPVYDNPCFPIKWGKVEGKDVLRRI